MMNLYIHGCTCPETPRKGYPVENVFTVQVEHREAPLWWQVQGLSYTASGYGKRIPTRYMVKYKGRWRRVYCAVFSNIGTLYIGKLNPTSERLIVRDCA